MTNPGVPTSPGFPALDPVAQQAIRAAQSRLDVLTRGKFPFPVRQLTEDEKAEALKTAKDDACKFCAALHPGASTAACPRLATFKVNNDGIVIEGSFWPEGVTDSEITMDGQGNVTSVTHREHVGWNTARVVFVSDVADDEAEGDEAANGLHPAWQRPAPMVRARHSAGASVPVLPCHPASVREASRDRLGMPALSPGVEPVRFRLQSLPAVTDSAASGRRVSTRARTPQLAVPGRRLCGHVARHPARDDRIRSCPHLPRYR